MSWGLALWDQRGQVGAAVGDRLMRVRYAGAGGVTLAGFNTYTTGVIILFQADGRAYEDYTNWNNSTKFLQAPGSGITFVVLEY